MTYFHPERTPVLPARRRAAARLQLEQAVERSAPSSVPRRRVKSTVITASVAAIVLCTGAFAFAEYQSVTNRAQARCYTMASMSGGPPYVAIAEASATITKGEVHNALEVCAALFRQGILRLGRPVNYSVRGPASYPVPPLVACTLPGGIAAVFPGNRDTCTKLDLPAAMRL